MDVFAPLYYKNFKCITDRCRHCCCIGWQIDIDSKTLNSYKKLEGRLGDKIRANIELVNDCAYIKMKENGHCPFLMHGLCEIISDLGEGYISEICREHPRFYNRVGNRLEVGLGAVCEEAARLILSSEEIGTPQKIGETAEAVYTTDCRVLRERDRILDILADKSISYTDAVKKIELEFDISASVIKKPERKNVFSALEYLDISHKNAIISAKYVPCAAIHREIRAFLAYMIYRHVALATDSNNLRSRIGFCLLSAEVVESFAASSKNLRRPYLNVQEYIPRK